MVLPYKKLSYDVAIINAMILERLDFGTQWFWNAFLLSNHHQNISPSFTSNLILPSSSLVASVEEVSWSEKKKHPPPMAVALPNLPGRQEVKFSGRKRVCINCSNHGHKTSSGRTPETTFGCSRCGVNLCRSGNSTQKTATYNNTSFILQTVYM